MAKADFLHGSVFHGLLNFMVPVLGALLLQAAYGAADVFVIGMFCDAASLSGVGTGSISARERTTRLRRPPERPSCSLP